MLGLPSFNVCFNLRLASGGPHSPRSLCLSLVAMSKRGRPLEQDAQRFETWSGILLGSEPRRPDLGVDATIDKQLGSMDEAGLRAEQERRHRRYFTRLGVAPQLPLAAGLFPAAKGETRLHVNTHTRKTARNHAQR